MGNTPRMQSALKKSAAVVILAAGTGTRMGIGKSKVFLELEGRLVLEYILRVFSALPETAEQVLVLPPGWEERTRPPLRERLDALRVEKIVEGGARRFDSMIAGVAATDPALPLIVIHDGARPFPPEEGVRAAVAKAAETGGAVLAVPAGDTLKRVDQGTGRIVETVPREGIYRAQTPQVFRREVLEPALAAARKQGLEPTDDAAVLEAMGHPVAVVKGDPLNLKLTVPRDLDLARAILRLRRKRGGIP